MAGSFTKDGKRLRVFAHYVLGRLIFLFFVCHPGTLATFTDGQDYLLHRYPNRDLVTTEGQLQYQRRHLTPRNAADYNMKTGVPEDVLNGNADDWTPDWAPSLEERFQSTVKAWLRGPSRARQAKKSAAESSVPSGMAFVPTPTARGTMDICSARANDWQKQRWMSLSELSSKPRVAAGLHLARGRRCGGGGAHPHRNCPGNAQMLLGFRSRGFPLRRGIFGASSVQTTGGVDNAGSSAVSADDVNVPAAVVTDTETMVVAAARTLEDPELTATSPDGLFSSLLGGAADVYDSALSFVGCALVTSPLGKRYLNAYDGHNTVPASAMRRSGGAPDMTGSAYELVGFSNIDPFEASGRRGGGASSKLLGR